MAFLLELIGTEWAVCLGGSGYLLHAVLDGSVLRQCRPVHPQEGFPTFWASGPVAVTDTIGTTIATLSSKTTFLELFILWEDKKAGFC